MDDAAGEERNHDLCRSYIPKLRTFVELQFHGTGEDTDDVVQGILEKALFRIHLYDPGYAFSTWIYTIAANHCRDLLRRRARRDDRTEALEHPDREPSMYPGPEEMAMADDDRSRMRRILRILPVRERQVLYLSVYEELGFREIARVMDMPIGTAKYLKHKARERIRILWTREESG